MSRKVPPGRVAELVRVATRVFIEQGFKNTQMADVASALGVAKGTVYLYVESKEALFDLVCRCADGASPPPDVAVLPLPTPKPGQTVGYVAERLMKNQALPRLTLALAQPAGDVAAEVEAIAFELFDLLANNREGIKLIDRSAKDLPELGALWFDGARGGLVSVFAELIERRVASGALRAVPDAALTARFVVESAAFWAVHRHWDPRPQPADEAVARQMVVAFVARILVPNAA